MTRTRSRESEPDAGVSTSTPAVWVIALCPFFYIAILWAIFSSAGQLDPLPLGIGLLDICAFVLLWAMVFLDHAALVARGIQAASVLWLLLSPIGYLIARRVRLKSLGMRANAPGNVFAVSLVAGIMLSGTLGATVISNIDDRAALANVQTQVATELTQKSATEWTVSCPSDAPVRTVGAIFVCQARDTAAHAVTVKATVVARDQFTLALVPASTGSASS